VSDEHDELTGIFDHLTPEDFSKRKYDQEDPFHQFVDAQLQATRTGFTASDGHLNPFAVLGDSGHTVTLTPTVDETLGEWISRLRTEAQRMNARWLYLARKTLVGHYDAHAGDPVPDTTDPEALAKALEEGLLREGMFFYAERTDNGKKESRHGTMRIDNNTLGPTVEGDSTKQTVDFFKGILG